MKSNLLAGAVAAVMTTGSALAADLPVTRAPTVIPAPADPWTGFYVGIHGGWGSGDVDFGNVVFSNNVLGGIDHHSMDGGLAGGHLGYNWQMNYTWLVGIEASGTWSGIKKSIVSPLFADFPNDRWTTEVKWFATLTPRIGVTLGNWMWYLKGGLAVAEVRHRLESPIGPTSVDTSDTQVGWTAGLGGEVLLGNWILGAEGNYYGFGSMNVNSATLLANFPSHDFDVSAWSILGRVSYKFGGPRQVVARY